MPEIAEVRIMSDFINYISSKEHFFEGIEKSAVSKVKTDLDVFEGGVFSIEAFARGKEMMIQLSAVGDEVSKLPPRKLLVTLGMSGNFAYAKKGGDLFEKIMKHSHLRFRTIRGDFLVLHDIRRFAKWKWVDGWSKGRGACPLTEFNKFSSDIRFKWKNHKVFESRLNEILMNQSVFNGIGNYLRAEILDRLDVNPFQPIKEIPQETLNELLKLCHLCCRQAYYFGGGELKDWVNPYGSDEEKTIKDWMSCYGKKMSIVDKTGRRFWFDEKWKDNIPEDYIAS